jgi:AcrR family transcriptional regulator
MLEAHVAQAVIDSSETPETRTRLLEAAEKLFAERGYEATSVRDITAEAGCNVAAVNYYFGGKDSLYLETFRNLLGALRDRRIERIRSDMAAAGDAATLELFLESMANAFLEPLVGEGRGKLLMAIVSREMVELRLPPEVFLGEFIHPLLVVTVEQLQAVGPPLDPMVANLCVMSLVGQLLHVLKVREMVRFHGDHGLAPDDLAEHVWHVVRFSAAGIRACAMENKRADECSTTGENA